MQSAWPKDGNDDQLISLPGRSPVLDAAQLGILRGYGSERDVVAGDVLFADGDETYDLIVLLFFQRVPDSTTAGFPSTRPGHGPTGVTRRRERIDGCDQK